MTEVDTKTHRVLVAEDSDTQRALLCAILRSAGFHPVEAKDGADALARLGESRVDAIVADGEMPRLDGYQLCRLIKDDPATRDVPVLLLTAKDAGFRWLRAQTCGADGFAPKGSPLATQLRSTVVSWLQEHVQPCGGSCAMGPRDHASWLSILANTVERSLMHSTIRRRVSALYDGSHDVRAICRGFIDLVRDAFAPGALAIAYPTVEGMGVVASSHIAVPHAIRSLMHEQMTELGVADPDADLSWSFDRQPSHRPASYDLSRVPVSMVPGQPDGWALLALPSLASDEKMALLHEALDELGRVLHVERAHVELYRSAVRDPLTGTWNRRHITELLARELDRAHRYSTVFSILMIDVDHFKSLNDSYGHPVGDAVLREVAARLQRNIRASDVLARYGGEEFIVVLPHTHGETAAAVAARLNEMVGSSTFDALPPDRRVTVSIGVADSAEFGDDVDALVAAADRRLYAAKAQGRNRTCTRDDAVEPAA